VINYEVITNRRFSYGRFFLAFCLPVIGVTLGVADGASLLVLLAPSRGPIAGTLLEIPACFAAALLGRSLIGHDNSPSGVMP
jgi:hypothetical protein